jgi:hypothetical protein
MNIPLEITVIEKYVKKDKQERYINFVSSKNHRSKFIKDLAHFKHLKWELFDKIQGSEVEIITTQIKQIKPAILNCYVISENTQIDAKILSIEDAMKETIGYGMATILVFGNVDLIYFEDEEPNRRFISRFLNIN